MDASAHPHPAPAAMLTVPETAERLSVSTRTVERLIAAGDLQAVRVGSAVRLAPEAIDAYLASHTTRGTTAA